MKRLIFHVDVNSAFLSWESVKRLENGGEDLRDIPAVIGGDPNSRLSVVLAKSIPAKKYGIITGEPVSSAMRKCPGLVVAPSDFKQYIKCSKAFKSILREYAPSVEEYSIDECFLDMSGTSLIYPEPISVAYTIKDRIRNDLGFTVNIGIGPNKLLAKMAGDLEKPDKIHTIFYDEVSTKMWPLNVNDLLLCGKASAKKLEKAMIYTIGDLANSDKEYIKSLLGNKMGALLHDYANGIDDSAVKPVPDQAKGYSNETTFEKDVVTYEEADRVLMHLSDSVAFRIRRDDVKASCVSVMIRGNDMKKHSHQRMLPYPTDITKEIYDIARMLLREAWPLYPPLRLIGLSLTSLDREGLGQMSFFGNDESRQKAQKADRAADEIRKKFGKGSIKLAGMMEGEIKVGKDI